MATGKSNFTWSTTASPVLNSSPMKTADKNAFPVNWPHDSDWTSHVESLFATEELRCLFEFVEEARRNTQVFPNDSDVFNAFRLCPFKQVKVVILGQDPYHGEGQAHGLSFSVQNNQKLPPSLRNIFKELANDVGCDNKHGDLTRWAEQGVLLLNTVLTVESGKAHSHKNQGWERFTDFVIELVGQRDEPAVFLLWGKPAQKKKQFIGNHHKVIETPHPSPLSAHRGFFGSQPFSQTNSALMNWGKPVIDWQV